MDLLYIDEVANQRQIDAQYYYFLLNYFIGEKINIHPNIGLMLYIYKNIYNVKNNELLDYYDYCNLQVAYATDGQGNKSNKEHELIRKETKRIQKLKNSKHLSKVDYYTIGLYNEFINKLKVELYNSMTKHISNFSLTPFIDLYDEDVITCSFSLLNIDYSSKDYEVGEKIFYNFKTREKLFVIDDVFQFGDELNILKGKKKKSLMKKMMK